MATSPRSVKDSTSLCFTVVDQRFQFPWGTRVRVETGQCHTCLPGSLGLESVLLYPLLNNPEKNRAGQMLLSVTLVDQSVRALGWVQGTDCVVGHLASTTQATASVVAVLSCAATTVCGMLIREQCRRGKVAALGQ